MLGMVEKEFLFGEKVWINSHLVLGKHVIISDISFHEILFSRQGKNGLELLGQRQLSLCSQGGVSTSMRCTGCFWLLCF